MIKVTTGEQLEIVRHAMPDFLTAERARIDGEQHILHAAHKPFCPPPQPLAHRFRFWQQIQWYGFWKTLAFWWRQEDSFRFIEDGFIGFKSERDRWV